MVGSFMLVSEKFFSYVVPFMTIMHRGRYVFGLLSQSGRYVSFYLLQI